MNINYSYISYSKQLIDRYNIIPLIRRYNITYKPTDQEKLKECNVYTELEMVISHWLFSK